MYEVHLQNSFQFMYNFVQSCVNAGLVEGGAHGLKERLNKNAPSVTSKVLFSSAEQTTAWYTVYVMKKVILTYCYGYFLVSFS